MLGFKKLPRFFSEFKKNEKGAMAITYIVTLSTCFIAIGAAYDLTKIHTGNQKAQHMADMIALSAASYVRQNGEEPEQGGEGYVDEVIYNLNNENLSLNPYGNTYNMDSNESIGKTNPEVVVDYWDDQTYDEEGNPQLSTNTEKNTVTATVTAYATPTFLSIFKGLSDVKFSAVSKVSYAKEDLKDPASVFLILDNSGSMSDPANDGTGRDRLEAVQDVVVDFMETLEELTDDAEKDVLRTALWAFSHPNATTSERVCWYNSRGRYRCRTEYTTATDNDAIFTETETAPQWGIVEPDTINAMSHNGWTDPLGALERADQAMLGEEAIHLAEDEEAEPHRFVILMSDGDIRAGGSPGYSDSSLTTASLAECTSLKNQGVRVYTIGFAITAGSAADTFLRNCGSPDMYSLASNADILEDAFNKIGEDILEEVIRVRS